MPALLWVHHFMMATKLPEYARPCHLTPSLIWDGLSPRLLWYLVWVAQDNLC